jgi:hypothetical protein
VQDAATGGPGAGVDANNAEVLWCAYAWPVDFGTTGNRSFFVNQRGEILQTRMAVLQYTGSATMPTQNAAFTAGGLMDPAGHLDGRSRRQHLDAARLIRTVRTPRTAAPKARSGRDRAFRLF